MKLFHIVFLLLHTIIPDSLLYQHGKENSLLKKIRIFPVAIPKHPRELLRHQQIKQFSTHNATKGNKFASKNRYKKDKELVSSSRSTNFGPAYRKLKQRATKYNRRKYSGESDRSSSLSEDMVLWKKQFDQDWIKLKQQAIAERKLHPVGDIVTMGQARPFASPCGDHNQHDWPWGTCTLPQQCEGEYRIYRGDLYCGRTSLVCCAVQLTQHDLYQGLDMSFVRTSTSSSDEKFEKQFGSKELRREKRRRAKIRRYRDRKASKERLRRKINQLLRRLKRSLNKAYRNTTLRRKIEKRGLIKAIALLKKKFRENRQSTKYNFDNAIEMINNNLFHKLIYLNALHQHFLVNQTFREFLKKHNLTASALRTLQLTTPNLAKYISIDGQISEGLQEILHLAMLKSSLEETDPTERAIESLNEISTENLEVDSSKISRIKKNDLRSTKTTINVNTDDPFSNNTQISPFVDSLNKTDSELVEQVDAETNLTMSNENYPLMEDNAAMKPETGNKTRRSGRGTIVKNKPAMNMEGYSEYDVEYGLLAYI